MGFEVGDAYSHGSATLAKALHRDSRRVLKCATWHRWTAQALDIIDSLAGHVACS